MEQTRSEEAKPSRILIPSMIVSFVAVAVTNSLLSLFSVDISQAFKVPVAVVLQLGTINNAGMFLFSLLMGAMAVRLKLKSLLLAGVVFVVVSAVGNYLALSFFDMAVFFLIEGIGSVMFIVMGQTLFGNVFEPRKRAKALSYVMAAGWATGLAGPTIVVFIARTVGWQSNFVLWVLPWSLVGLALTFLAVPSKSNVEPTKLSVGKAFKTVLKDKSATSCLAANILAVAGTEVGIFAIPFYRQVFSLSRELVALWATVVVAIFIVGILTGGRLVNKFGAKTVAVIGILMTGIFTMIFFFIPNLWVTLFFDSLHVVFASIALPAYGCLALAQVPSSRGTMMSLNLSMDHLGKIVATAVGGTLLAVTVGIYGSVGLLLGGLSVISAVILFRWAKDPTRDKEPCEVSFKERPSP